MELFFPCLVQQFVRGTITSPPLCPGTWNPFSDRRGLALQLLSQKSVYYSIQFLPISWYLCLFKWFFRENNHAGKSKRSGREEKPWKQAVQRNRNL